MSYRTTCPHCVSVFRLEAGQLDAAQGWVQCSVCGAAFDARPSLLLEDGSPLPPLPPLAEPEQPESIEVAPLPEPAAGEQADAETEPVATAEAASPDEDAAAAPDAADATDATDVTDVDTLRGIAQREVPLELPSIILIDPDLPVPDDPGPLPQISTAAVPAAAVYPPRFAASAPASPVAQIEYAAPLPGAARGTGPRRRIKPWIWAVGSVLLLVLLLAQSAYFLRDTLVSRLPQTRPGFEQACAVLGCRLSLPKDLDLLQIVGSDLQTEAPGRLELVLTLGNRAGHAQAWPVLVLTLTDQRNRPLARRSFAPSEYLGNAQRIADGIPPRSEQLLSLPLDVRDLAPMGFGLQLTY